MGWLKSATVAAFALAVSGLFLTPAADAQINGVPASVTSINFGGKQNPTPGVPPSVTSVGPAGFQGKSPFFNEPLCCINPLFPSVPNPPFFHRDRHHRGLGFPGGGAVYVPYAVPYPVPVEAEGEVPPQAEREPAEDYRGGPTLFDRRGSGTPATTYREGYERRTEAAEPERQVASAPRRDDTSVTEQPLTVLVFKNGHKTEVQNYAVVGDMLFDLTPGQRRKIPLADLDLALTAKQNDERGIDFQLPSKPGAVK